MHLSKRLKMMVIIIQRILQGLPILKAAAADEAQELTLHFNSIFTEPVKFFIICQISDFRFRLSFFLFHNTGRRRSSSGTRIRKSTRKPSRTPHRRCSPRQKSKSRKRSLSIWRIATAQPRPRKHPLSISLKKKSRREQNLPPIPGVSRHFHDSSISSAKMLSRREIPSRRISTSGHRTPSPRPRDGPGWSTQRRRGRRSRSSLGDKKWL